MDRDFWDAVAVKVVTRACVILAILFVLIFLMGMGAGWLITALSGG